MPFAHLALHVRNVGSAGLLLGVKDSVFVVSAVLALLGDLEVLRVR